MSLSLPYRADRRYLLGMDWLVNLLHHVSVRQTGVGTSSQLVLELAGRVDVGELRRRWRRFAAAYPLVHGRPGRDWLNLCPYWRVPGRPADPDAAIVERDLPADLAEPVNTPFAAAAPHVRWTVFQGADRAVVVLTFDHRLLDAGGAGALLERIARPETAPDVATTAAPLLCDWTSRFAAGRRVNRFLLAMKDARVCRLTAPPGRAYRFATVALDAAQTAAVEARAEAAAGYLMLMPYLAAQAVRAMQPLFAARGVAGTEYLVPVSVDNRERSAPLAQTFFNHLSFLFARVAASAVDDPPELVRQLVRQFYEQHRAGLPQDLAEANLLLRICPLPLLDLILRRWARNNFGSFFFAYVDRCLFTGPDFLGTPVVNLAHMPRLPVPPGLGIVCSRFSGRLTATVACLEGLLTAAEQDALAARLHHLLTETD